MTSPLSNDNLQTLGENINPFFGYQTYRFGVDNKSQYLHGIAEEQFPWRDAALGLYLMRLLSIGMGAAAVWAIYQIGRTLFDDERVALLTAALVALNPMFLYIQASVHNDALTNLMAALTFWALIRYWVEPTLKQAVWVGVVAALGILTKITFLFLGPMVLIVMVARHAIHRKTDPDWPRKLILELGTAGTLVVAIAGWWFVRNQLLYGEPTSMELQASIWQPRPNAPDWAAAIRELGYLRDSFWGVFGFGQIVYPRSLYATINLFVSVSVIGSILWAARRTRDSLHEYIRPILIALLLIGPLTAFTATFSRMSISETANFGRYLFTTYGIIAPLLAIGWVTATEAALRFSRPSRTAITSFLAVALIALNGFALFGVLRPVFTPPPTVQSAAELPVHRAIDVIFDDTIRLIGYDIQPASVLPGEPFEVTLYWEAPPEPIDGNYVEFVQLVSADGERIAGRDTLHGLGRYPTGRWQPNDILVDSIPLYPEDSAFSEPTGLRIDVGLFRPDGTAATLPSGETTLTLGLVRQAGSTPVNRLPIYVFYSTFGDAIHLSEVIGLPATAKGGDTFDLDLHWWANQEINEAFNVLVHLVEPGNPTPLAQYDSAPTGGVFPTSLWEAQDYVIDERSISLPIDLPPGDYDLLVGLYRLTDFSRLPVTHAGPFPSANETVTVGTIHITE